MIINKDGSMNKYDCFSIAHMTLFLEQYARREGMDIIMWPEVKEIIELSNIKRIERALEA